MKLEKITKLYDTNKYIIFDKTFQKTQVEKSIKKLKNKYYD